ncbi:MAG: AEC family transporter [Candidatus Omnitrophica bacterium]|nr:AEC family transporter [Candidatus Omnitrophota bacterium]
MQIDFSFITILLAMAKLSLLALTGYLFYQLKLINGEFVDMMSKVLVRLLFPALIVSKTITNLDFKEIPYWWALPLSAMAYALAGMLLGWVVLRVLKGFSSPRELMCASGFQNCGYLPMNLIAFAFAGEAQARLLVYVILFVFGFDLIMWSIVPLFLSGRLRSDFTVSKFFNVPVLATFFSVSWVAIFGNNSLPAVMMDPVGQLGQAAFPMAMFVLGAFLNRYKAFRPKDPGPVAVTTIVKLLVLPALVMPILLMVNMAPDLKFFLFLQAMLPTAVSMVVVGSFTGADNEFLSSVIFYTHLAAIITMPLCLGIFRVLGG